MVNRKCPYPRGKGFGGTTLINGLIYSRGNRRDFDKWESDGNPGWNYRTVLKYFIQSENSTLTENVDVNYHGTKGELNVQHHPIESLQTRKFIEANSELGTRETDYNGEHQLGVSRIQTNIRNGQRLTAYRAFVEPVRNNRNLKLLPESYVTKIYVNETANVRMVYFSHRKQLYRVRANKEIILSAGSISSPQILMLSGIGPREHLRKLNIKVVKNLPVGNNLQDHTVYYGTYFETSHVDPEKSVKEYVKEYLNGTGFYTVAANLQGIGYFVSSKSEGDYSDVELIIVPSPILNEYTQTAFRFTDETYNGLWGNVNGNNSFIIYIVLLRPKSQGTIRLASNDPYDYPLIDSRFLSDSKGEDIRKVYDTIKYVNKLQTTKAFRSINAKIGRINLPACTRNYRRNSKEYWYCNIRHLTFNLYHPVGTNKMGPNPNDGAVVDSKFRVHGFKTLRVVDASVLPFSFAGHPAASSFMIGERAFDFILNDHRNDL